jgi:hypothetical protein
MIVTLARRVPTQDDIVKAGDYSGPHPIVMNGEDHQVIWFLLPTHKGEDKFDHVDEHSGLHGVYSTLWTFRECEDGSLEIRPSIGCGKQPYYWHGYLDEGNSWREL